MRSILVVATVLCVTAMSVVPSMSAPSEIGTYEDRLEQEICSLTLIENSVRPHAIDKLIKSRTPKLKAMINEIREQSGSEQTENLKSSLNSLESGINEFLMEIRAVDVEYSEILLDRMAVCSAANFEAAKDWVNERIKENWNIE